ncbi:MAG: dynamin family protein [Akkermansia sp.]|nr:dynamin family protein [Akkermansia sp.]
MSKNILHDKPEAQAALAQVSRTIDSISDQLKVLRDSELNKCFERLRRDVKQYGSDISIVVSMGMLKAGKSTLVNVLARCDTTSPTGYGVDTTLRPALIRMRREDDKNRNQGHIVVYFYTPPQEGDTVPTPNSCDSDKDDDNRNKQMECVLDELRGIEQDSGFPKQEYPLEEEYLQTILCSRPEDDRNNYLHGKEPLLVLVETPYRNRADLINSDRMHVCDDILLKEGRMLLDMPGLDSGEADVSRHMRRYMCLLEDCDALMFVQSSVAPLNEKARENLKAILSQRRSASITIVQNIMLSKPWRNADVNNAEQGRQHKHAIGLVKAFAKEVNRDGGEPDTFLVNLGMAYDSMFEDQERYNEKYILQDTQAGDGRVTYESLWAASKVKSLEDSLIDQLDKNGTSNRIQHCNSSLKNHCRHIAEDVLGRIRDTLGQKSQTAETTRKRWVEMRDRLDVDMKDSQLVKCPASYHASLSQELQKVVDSCEKEYAEKFQNQDSIPGSDIDSFLVACDKMMREHCCALLKNATCDDIDVEVAGGRKTTLRESCKDTLEGIFQKWRTGEVFPGGAGEAEGNASDYHHLYDMIQHQYRPQVKSKIEMYRLNIDSSKFPKPSQPKKYKNTNFFNDLTKHLELTKRMGEVTYAYGIWQDELDKIKRFYEDETAKCISDNYLEPAQLIFKKVKEEGYASLRQKMSDYIREQETKISGAKQNMDLIDRMVACFDDVYDSLAKIQ